MIPDREGKSLDLSRDVYIIPVVPLAAHVGPLPHKYIRGAQGALPSGLPKNFY